MPVETPDVAADGPEGGGAIDDLRAALEAAQDEIERLTRQRDDARDLVARSGYFIDCEKGAGRDCVMWHRAGMHEDIASDEIIARSLGGVS